MAHFLLDLYENRYQTSKYYTGLLVVDMVSLDVQ
jgi:hypothetical protein